MLLTVLLLAVVSVGGSGLFAEKDRGQCSSGQIFHDRVIADHQEFPPIEKEAQQRAAFLECTSEFEIERLSQLNLRMLSRIVHALFHAKPPKVLSTRLCYLPRLLVQQFVSLTFPSRAPPL